MFHSIEAFERYKHGTDLHQSKKISHQGLAISLWGFNNSEQHYYSTNKTDGLLCTT